MPIKIKLNELQNHKPGIEPESKSALVQATSQKNTGKITALHRECSTNFEAMNELNRLIGMQKIKDLIFEVQAYAQIQRIRCENALNSEPIVLHSIFKGNPGTGKTTVARLLAKLYQEMGILSKGQLIEVERADLVGEYIGHTAQKTKEQIKRALGGVLFIDEAYSLCRGGEKDFGREAIDVLVKAMEDHKNEFILILAGYSDEMNYFLQSNTGLLSRLPLQIDFIDYSINELISIIKQMYNNRDYYINEQAETHLRNRISQEIMLSDRTFGNARTMRNIMEASLRMQAVRLIKSGSNHGIEALKQITSDDIIKACESVSVKQKDNKPSFNIIEGGFNNKNLNFGG